MESPGLAPISIDTEKQHLLKELVDLKHQLDHLKVSLVDKINCISEYEVLVQNVFQTLNCGLCQEIFQDPWTLSCGHTFCCNCLRDAWCKLSQITLNSRDFINDGKKCPSCKTIINNPPIHVQALIRQRKCLHLRSKTALPNSENKARLLPSTSSEQKQDQNEARSLFFADSVKINDDINKKPQNQSKDVMLSPNDRTSPWRIQYHTTICDNRQQFEWDGYCSWQSQEHCFSNNGNHSNSSEPHDAQDNNLLVERAYFIIKNEFLKPIWRGFCVWDHHGKKYQNDTSPEEQIQLDQSYQNTKFATPTLSSASNVLNDDDNISLSEKKDIINIDQNFLTNVPNAVKSESDFKDAAPRWKQIQDSLRIDSGNVNSDYFFDNGDDSRSYFQQFDHIAATEQRFYYPKDNIKIETSLYDHKININMPLDEQNDTVSNLKTAENELYISDIDFGSGSAFSNLDESFKHDDIQLDQKSNAEFSSHGNTQYNAQSSNSMEDGHQQYLFLDRENYWSESQIEGEEIGDIDRDIDNSEDNDNLDGMDEYDFNDGFLALQATQIANSPEIRRQKFILGELDRHKQSITEDQHYIESLQKRMQKRNDAENKKLSTLTANSGLQRPPSMSTPNRTLSNYTKIETKKSSTAFVAETPDSCLKKKINFVADDHSPLNRKSSSFKSRLIEHCQSSTLFKSRPIDRIFDDDNDEYIAVDKKSIEGCSRNISESSDDDFALDKDFDKDLTGFVVDDQTGNTPRKSQFDFVLDNDEEAVETPIIKRTLRRKHNPILNELKRRRECKRRRQ